MSLGPSSQGREWLPLTEATDRSRCGGKAARLAAMLELAHSAQQKIKIPAGMVLTVGTGESVPADSEARVLGLRYPVAVRSSATLEDGSQHSFAGQFRSTLDVKNFAELEAAVRACFDDIQAPALQAYLKKNDLTVEASDMAILVQEMVPADCAGVLFMADPLTGSEAHQMLEAVAGIGEGLVSGEAQPDQWRLSGTNDALEIQQISHAGKSGLGESQITQLLEAGHELNQAFGAPQDIEWAIHDDCIYLLQSRDITVRGTTPSQGATPYDLPTSGGPWVRHNIGEELDCPTPLTWSVLKRFMQQGAYKNLLCELGYKPGPRFEEKGYLDLIGGRIYIDLDRAPEMFAEDFPYRYDLEALESQPDIGHRAPSLPHTGGKTGRSLRAAKNMLKQVGRKLDTLELAEQIPLDWPTVRAGASRSECVAAWRDCETMLNDGSLSYLLPGAIATHECAKLERSLQNTEWNPAAVASAAAVPCRPIPPPRFSYELARPAKTERGKGRKNKQTIPSSPPSNGSRLEQGVTAREECKQLLLEGMQALRHIALEIGQQLGIGDQVFHLSRNEFLALASSEATEVTAIQKDELEARAIKHREQEALNMPMVLRRASEERGDAYRTTAQKSAGQAMVLGLSPGIAKGKAILAHRPDQLNPASLNKETILVCPSTNPAWIPLLSNCGGLVLERGGALSHGAIVAREMGLPCVVYSDAMSEKDGLQRLRDGQAIEINGSTGELWIDGEAVDQDPLLSLGPAPELPPAPTRKELQGFRIAMVAGGTSIVALLGLYAGKGWPLAGLFDRALWPLVGFFNSLPAWLGLSGKVGAVAIIGAGMAGLVLLAQRCLTDHKSLKAVQASGLAMRKEAKQLPKDARRRAGLERLALAGGTRQMKASFIGLAWLLLPLSLCFLWMSHRFDPAHATVAPGGEADITLQLAAEAEAEAEAGSVSLIQGQYIVSSETARDPNPAVRNLLDDWEANGRPDRLPIDAGQDDAKLLQSLREAAKKPLAPSPLTWRVRSAEEPGTNSFILEFPDERQVAFEWVTGKDQLAAPEPRLPKELATSLRVEPVREAIVGDKGGFWRPFQRLGWGIDLGWFGTYLVSYLLTLFGLRKILRLP